MDVTDLLPDTKWGFKLNRKILVQELMRRTADRKSNVDDPFKPGRVDVWCCSSPRSPMTDDQHLGV